jgi:lactam utilization protein B
VHGDNIGAVNLVKNIREMLEANDIKVKPMGKG